MSSTQEWLKLTDRTKRNIFEETAAAIGLPQILATFATKPL